MEGGSSWLDFRFVTFSAPDETRKPDKTQVDVVKMGANTAARLTLEPGWKWSECIKPIAGTDSCQVRHVGVVQSGRMHMIHDDGSEGEIGPGEAYVIEPGHDAWVVGDEPMVGFEFESPTAEVFAKGWAPRTLGCRDVGSGPAVGQPAARGCRDAPHCLPHRRRRRSGLGVLVRRLAARAVRTAGDPRADARCSELIYTLVRLDKEFSVSQPDERWEDAHARALVATFPAAP